MTRNIGQAKTWFFRVVITPFENIAARALAPQPDADTHPELAPDAMPYGDSAYAVDGLRGVLFDAFDIVTAFHAPDKCDLEVAFMVSRLASLRVALSNASGSHVMRTIYSVNSGMRFYELLVYMTRHDAPGHDGRDPATTPADAQADATPPRSFRVSTTR